MTVYIVLLQVMSFMEVSKSLQNLAACVGSRHLACWKQQTNGCGMEISFFVNGNLNLENGILLGVWQHHGPIYMSQKWWTGENDQNSPLI